MSDFEIENGVLKKYTGNGGDVVIPNGVTKIGGILSGAFFNCKNLTSVTIPNSVTEIGYRAFGNCKSLTSVTIPNSVTEIGCEAFSWCENLTSVTIPEGVISIGARAFEYCYSLTSVTIPNSVTSINDGTFDHGVFSACKSLTAIHVAEANPAYSSEDGVLFNKEKTVLLRFPGGKSGAYVIPDSVTCIGHDAFSGCESLTSVTIPEGVTGIGENAFHGCKSLTSVTIPDSVTDIGEWAFCGCRSLTSVTIPEGVTEVGERAFEYCDSLTSVTIPNSVTSIGEWAFSESRGLKSVTIPDSVTGIGKGAFCGCRSLTSVTIPDSVTAISDYAFSGCESLTSVVFEGKYPKLGWDVFSDCEKLYLPPDEIRADLPLPVALSEICPPLTDELRAHLILFQTEKAWIEIAENSVTAENADDTVRAIAALLGAQQKPSVKIGNRAAEFTLLCNKAVSAEPLRALMAALEEKKCKKALEKLRTDPAVAAKLTVEQAAPKHPIEALVQKNWVVDDAVKKFQPLIKAGVPFADADGCSSPEAVVFVVAAYARQMRFYGSSFDGDYTKFRLDETADQVAAGLNREELLALLGQIAFEKKESRAIPALARYGGEQQAEALRAGSQNKAWTPNCRKAANRALILSDTRTAMLHMEKVGRLEEYAKLRGTDADTLRDTVLADFGLDDAGKKTFDLGGKIVSAFVGQDLKVALYDETEGKAVKSLPKRGADPEKYATAEADLSDLKKNVKKVVKARNDQLLGSFLDGKSYPSANWQKAYLTNPVLRRVAELLVWAQDKATFTLGKDGPIHADGSAYAITGKPITVAHPMEMQAADVTAWQSYFVANGLKQPFEQVWEPVIDPKTIRPDRYKGQEVMVFRFQGREKHGIGFYKEGSRVSFGLKDCELDYETNALSWALSAEDVFTLGKFSFRKYTRYTNHIVALLDRWTITGRILKDDVTVQESLGSFTAAQIMEYIRLASENNCTNCTAMLLEYKQTHYPAFDPLAEFTLE